MLPTISICALGGTISMTKGDDELGITSKLGAKELIEAIPILNSMANLRVTTLAKVPSGAITFNQLHDVLTWANKEIKDGSKGIILTQGTDTLEESAFYLSLFWDHPEPLIVMGAMRHPEAIGAEGGANLYASVACALSPQARGRGVMVVMNDCIHSVLDVLKGHSLSVDAFNSPNLGELGRLNEGRAVFFKNTKKPPTLRLSPLTKQVFLHEHSLDEDVSWLTQVLPNYAGLVISAFGAGHISEKLRDALTQSNISNIPVVIATRTGRGSTAYKTYAYKGSEIDLQNEGFIMAGFLHARKARLLLMSCLNNNYSKEKIKEYFHEFGSFEP